MKTSCPHCYAPPQRVTNGGATAPAALLAPLLAIVLACGPEARIQPILEPLFEPSSEGAILCEHQARVGIVLGSGSAVETRSVRGDTGTIAGSICQPDGLPIFGELALLSENGEKIASVRLDRGSAWSLLDFEIEGGDPTAARRLRFAGDEDQRLVLTGARWISQETAPAATRTEDPLRVFLISIDTLRADILDHPEHTPHLVALSQDGQRFENAYAAASWTRPSHISLLSGRLPAVHGLIGFDDPIPPELQMVSQRLQATGIQTLGMVADIVQLDGSRGFDHGFDEYVEYAGQSARGVAELGRKLGQVDEERPLFAFFHLFDSHSDGYVLPYEGADWTPAKVRERHGLADYGCENDLCATARLMGFERGETASLPEEPKVLSDLYLAGVQTADQSVGTLVTFLRDLGWYDDALIIVTSDHGESLLDPSPRVTHGNNWEPVLRVPLLIKWPKDLARTGTVDSPVSGIDVAPTILDLAGLPTDDLLGRNLAEPVPAGRPIFSGTLDHVVWRGGWKLNYGERGELLFYLPEDGDELDNRFAAHNETAKALRELSRRRYAAGRLLYESSAKSGQEQSLSPEEVQRLRSLGYLDAGP